MFIDPRVAIEEGWITHPECNTLEDWTARKYLGPNAIDYPASRLYILDPPTEISLGVTLTEHSRAMRHIEEVKSVNMFLPLSNKNEDVFQLIPNYSYDVLSDMYVEIPEGVTCILFPRSSLTRNGIFTVNGLYDTGFKGNIGTVLVNSNCSTTLGVNTRIGQIAFLESRNAGVYAGGWNHARGSHYREENDGNS